MADEEKSDKGEKATTRGRFWGALIAQLIVGLAAASGISWGLNQGHSEDVKTKATETAKTTAAEAAKARDEAIAAYVNEKLRPEVTKALKEVDHDLLELESRIQECNELARNADRDAYAALRIAESRFGLRTVQRELDRAETEVPPAKKKPSVVQTMEKELPVYNFPQQRTGE